MEEINKNLKILTIFLTLYLVINLSMRAQPIVQTYSYTGTYRTFTVPQCATSLTIDVCGAQGGWGNAGAGGKGARMIGVFTPTPGSVLHILVGQCPGDVVTGAFTFPGGGGGSFVGIGTTSATAQPLIVAGGGGGGYGATGNAAPVTTSGTGLTPGINGNGAPASSCGGGGGGFFTSGGDDMLYGFLGGKGFLQGGTGGLPAAAYLTTYQPGGFGGGTAANYVGSCNLQGGNGGGYSGGSGYNTALITTGTAGGSFNSGTNQNNTAGYQSGHGLVTITYSLSDVVGATQSTTEICQGGSVQLNGTGSVVSYTWNVGAPGQQNITVSPNVTTTYSVSATNTAGCISMFPVTVTVNPLPTISFVTTPSLLCVGKTATVVASGANTYAWNTGPVGNIATFNPVTTTIYTVTGVSLKNCVSNQTVAVLVNSNTLGITPSTTICAESSLTLTANNAVTYTWSTGNNFASTPVSPLSNTTYTASGTDIHNCVISNVVNVTVDPKPNVSASASKNTICKGESADLTASGASSYTWSGASGTGAQVTVNPPVDVVYNYTVAGTGANGCTNTAVVAVTVSRCTGLSKLTGDISAATIYPNPSSGEVTIELGNAMTNTIEVLDLTGRIVFSTVTKKETVQVNLDNLSNGVYYFRIKSANATETIKVVKSN